MIQFNFKLRKSTSAPVKSGDFESKIRKILWKNERVLSAGRISIYEEDPTGELAAMRRVFGGEDFVLCAFTDWRTIIYYTNNGNISSAPYLEYSSTVNKIRGEFIFSIFNPALKGSNEEIEYFKITKSMYLSIKDSVKNPMPIPKEQCNLQFAYEVPDNSNLGEVARARGISTIELWFCSHCSLTSLAEVDDVGKPINTPNRCFYCLRSNTF